MAAPTYDDTLVTYDDADISYGGYGPGMYNAPGVTYNEVGFTYNLFEDTRTQLGVNDLRVDLFLRGGSWSNITSGVRTEEGIRLGRGCSSEDAEASPAWASMTLDNLDGRYSPRNPASAFYGLIGRNAPVRIGLGLPVVGETDTGTGTTLDLATIASSNGFGAVAVQAVGIISTVTNLTTPGGYGNAVEQDAAAFTVKRSTFIESDVVLPSSMTASLSGNWATAHVAVPGGTFAIADGGTADLGESPSAADTSGLTVGDVVVAVVAWTADPYGRMGPPIFIGSTDPAEMYLVADSGASTGPRIAVWAWRHRAGATPVGFTGAFDGATGATFQISVWSGAAAWTSRFCGEISDWPLAWSKGAHDKTINVQAGGVMRRLAQSQDQPSALRQALAPAGDLAHYWPMEDPEGSVDFAPLRGGTRMAPVNGISPAAVSDIAGSTATPSFTGRGARGPVFPVNAAPWGFGGVVAIPESGSATGNNLLVGECATGGDLSSFGLEYTSNTVLTIKAAYTTGATASASIGSLTGAFPNGINGKQILIYVALAQSGGNVAWSVSVINVTPTEPLAQLTATGSLVTHTVGPLAAVTAGVEAGSSATIGTNDISAGHVFVTNGAVLDGSIYRMYAARAYAGAKLTEAAWSTARDAGIPLTFTYPAGDQLVAGRVEPGSGLAQIRTMAKAGQALMQDAAGFPGLEWRSLASVVSREPVYVFDYANDTFTDPLAPRDDDSTTVNDVTITSTGGGMGRVVVEVGPLGAQPGGVGRYADAQTLPVAGATAARGLAGWLTNLGTFDAQRWPEVGLEMSGAGNAALVMSALSIGDTVRLDNIPSFTGPASIDLVITGFVEEFDSARWVCTLITRPAGPYRVLVWNDAEFGVWADSAAPSATDSRWSL